MITQLLSPILSQILHQAVQASPATLVRLPELAGTKMGVSCEDLGLEFILDFTEETILFTPKIDPNNCDVVITGRALSLLQMQEENFNAKPLFDQEIIITGDTELGQQCQEILKNIEVDWEGKLSYYLGHRLSYPLIQTINKFWAWLNHLSIRTQENITEVLQEESQQLVSRCEVEDFMSDVDKLRLDSQRVFARYDNLVKQGVLS